MDVLSFLIVPNLERRVCNDGGRLSRPVLRVCDNKAIITQDIIKKLVDKELSFKFCN